MTEKHNAPRSYMTSGNTDAEAAGDTNKNDKAAELNKLQAQKQNGDISEEEYLARKTALKT